MEFWLISMLNFTQPIHRMAGSVLHPVSQSLTHFLNVPASPEEDEEKEICGSVRGEGQFILDLWEGVFPRDQSTQ